MLFAFLVVWTVNVSTLLRLIAEAYFIQKKLSPSNIKHARCVSLRRTKVWSIVSSITIEDVITPYYRYGSPLPMIVIDRRTVQNLCHKKSVLHSTFCLPKYVWRPVVDITVSSFRYVATSLSGEYTQSAIFCRNSSIAIKYDICGLFVCHIIIFFQDSNFQTKSKIHKVGGIWL